MMKKNNYIPGGMSILAISILLLFVQFALLWQFYTQQGPSLFKLMCASGAADAWANYCMVPRWVGLIGSAIHCVCVLTSVCAYKRMGRRWWYIALPLVSLCALTIAIILIPMVHAETVK